MSSSLSNSIRWIGEYLVASLLATIWGLLQIYYWELVPAQYAPLSVVASTALGLVIPLLLAPVLGIVHRVVGTRGGAWSAPGTALLVTLSTFIVLTTPLGYYTPLLETPAVAFAKNASLWCVFAIGSVLLLRATLVHAPFHVAARRSSFALLALAVAVFGVSVVTSGRTSSEVASLAFERSAERRPHVFVILVDTLRADHLSVYGYDRPTSPQVDAFAADSTLFERAFSHAPWTRPSAAALLTSQYPADMQMQGILIPLPEAIPILPQFLRGEGYATAGIVSTVHISPIFGFDKGFDLLDNGGSILQFLGVKQPMVRLGMVEKDASYPRHNAEQLSNITIDWVASHAAEDAPVGMYLHYSDPHAPYRPPADEDRWREFATPLALQVSSPPEVPPRNGEILSRAQVEAMVARYDAEIAYFDHHFGRLIAYLKESGIYEDSLIVVTSDHGEEFLEHGGWEHTHTMHNELLHVPMIVKYPEWLGQKPGTRSQEAVSLVDVLPTIQEVLGAEWPNDAFRGQSLLELGGEPRTIYADNETPEMRSIYSGADKIIQHLDGDGNVVSESYYSMSDDFLELGSGEIPAAFAEHRLDALREVMKDLAASPAQGTEVDVDEETMSELRALGYVE